MTLDAFVSTETELHSCMKQWRQQLDTAYDQHPRLLFLDCKQLPHLMKRLAQLATQQQQDHRKLAPYMMYCFPEYTEIRDDILATAFDSILLNNIDALVDSKGIGGVYLKVATELMTTIQTALGEANMKQRVKPNAPQVVLHETASSLYLFVDHCIWIGQLGSVSNMCGTVSRHSSSSFSMYMV